MSLQMRYWFAEFRHSGEVTERALLLQEITVIGEEFNVKYLKLDYSPETLEILIEYPDHVRKLMPRLIKRLLASSTRSLSIRSATWSSSR